MNLNGGNLKSFHQFLRMLHREHQSNHRNWLQSAYNELISNRGSDTISGAGTPDESLTRRIYPIAPHKKPKVSGVGNDIVA